MNTQAFNTAKELKSFCKSFNGKLKSINQIEIGYFQPEISINYVTISKPSKSAIGGVDVLVLQAPFIINY